MRKMARRLVMLVTALMLVATAVTPAHAANTLGKIDSYLYKGRLVLNYQPGTKYYLRSANATTFTAMKGRPVTSIRRNNKSIVDIDYDKYNNTLQFVPKKLGTTKVSFMYRGKRRYVKVIVVKRKNPIKKLLIGSTDYASKFAKLDDNYDGAGIDIRGKRINVTPISGWKVKKISVGMESAPDWKTVKNGGTIPGASTFSWHPHVEITLQSKTTGIERKLYLYCGMG